MDLTAALKIWFYITGAEYFFSTSSPEIVSCINASFYLRLIISGTLLWFESHRNFGGARTRAAYSFRIVHPFASTSVRRSSKYNSLTGPCPSSSALFQTPVSAVGVPYPFAAPSVPYVYVRYHTSIANASEEHIWQVAFWIQKRTQKKTNVVVLGVSYGVRKARCRATVINVETAYLIYFHR